MWTWDHWSWKALRLSSKGFSPRQWTQSMLVWRSVRRYGEEGVLTTMDLSTKSHAQMKMSLLCGRTMARNVL